MAEQKNRAGAMAWTGRILSALIALLFCFGGVMCFFMTPQMKEGMAELGWTAHFAIWLGVIEIVCALLYAIPQTAVLGAILLTGYLGGAVATHMRINDPTGWAPFILGVLVWLGIFLRERRLRAILPFRDCR